MKIIREFLFSFLIFLASLFWFCLPTPLFTDKYSDILLSADSSLLGAHIAPDGQWRFPEIQDIPEQMKQAVLAFEDKRFYYHPGIDPLAILRAAKLNIAGKRVVSGGSTITMQLVRLSRKNAPRIFSEKLIEAILALRIELAYSKNEILALYLSHAPFGGNTVGIDAASWRYFNRPLTSLSWAEYATLAVLPNAPALIHPGRNRDYLRKKRNALLLRLWQRGNIDELTYSLSIDEPIPEQPASLPRLAPHLLDRLVKERHTGRLQTSVDYQLQRQVLETVNRYSRINQTNYIANMAVLVADIHTREVLAYVGNPTANDEFSVGRQVDMVMGERSTGSLLKPILYAGMLDAGQLLPTSLVPDVPLYINGFVPHNYDKQFHGAVPANMAISRSLNVPLVRMLQKYDCNRFCQLLKDCGMNTLYYEPSHYGLSVILGGAEGTLWNLTSIYASLARVLQPDECPYMPVQPLSLLPTDSLPAADPFYRPPLSAAALWYAFESMAEVNRPEEEADWQSFSGMKKIAWKTGTSYGARDAWAVGFTPRHIVGVWVGNASGEGRAGLSGVGYAAPVLFDVFSFLPSSGWFKKPEDQMSEVSICRRSGYKAGQYCDVCDTLMVPRAGKESAICPFHQPITLDATGSYRVTADNYPFHRIMHKNWFTLPPAQEYYYRLYNADYEPLPPILPGCSENENRIELIYPTHNTKIYLPVGFRGTREKFVLKAAHGRPDASLFWHINGTYYGETTENHQIAVALDAGEYYLTLVDDTGVSRKIHFSVVNSPKEENKN